eukprot:scaffold869_cov105-Isochrysis_galbana.AAC.16
MACARTRLMRTNSASGEQRRWLALHRAASVAASAPNRRAWRAAARHATQSSRASTSSLWPSPIAAASAESEAPMARASPGKAPAERKPCELKVVEGAIELAVSPARPADLGVPCEQSGEQGDGGSRRARAGGSGESTKVGRGGPATQEAHGGGTIPGRMCNATSPPDRPLLPAHPALTTQCGLAAASARSRVGRAQPSLAATSPASLRADRLEPQEREPSRDPRTIACPDQRHCRHSRPAHRALRRCSPPQSPAWRPSPRRPFGRRPPRRLAQHRPRQQPPPCPTPPPAAAAGEVRPPQPSERPPRSTRPTAPPPVRAVGGASCRGRAWAGRTCTPCPPRRRRRGKCTRSKHPPAPWRRQRTGRDTTCRTRRTRS